eukprot:6192156-Pleurochrysis_carterae.AAC.2
MSVCGTFSTVRTQVKTYGSKCDCLKPHEISQGRSERCQRRPACAMPCGFCRPARWSRNPAVDDSTRPHLVRAPPVGRLPQSPIAAWTVRAGLRVRQVSGGMWLASWRRMFVHSRRRTQISRTSALPGGTALRSMSSQLPLSVWFAISARSAAVHPVRSSRNACLRVFGSVLEEEARRAQPVLRVGPMGRVESWTVNSAVGDLLRSGYAPKPRWKCSWSVASLASVDPSATVGGVLAAPAVSLKLTGAVPAVADVGCARLGASSLSCVRGGRGSREWDGAGCTEFSVILPAKALAMIMFRSGGLETGGAQESRVFLRARTQGTERERNAGARVVSVEFLDGWHEPDGSVTGVKEEWRCDVTPVRGVFQEVLGTGVASGAKERSRSFDRNIRLLGHIRESSDVLAIAYGGRPAVRYVSLKEAADGEGGAWWRCHDSGVSSGGASSEQSGVDRIEKEVV